MATAAIGLALLAASCGTGGSEGSPPRLPAPPPPVTMTVSTGVEPEGTLDLVAPPGAFPRALLERFTRTNGCLVSVHAAPDPSRLSGLLGAKGQAADVVAVRSDRARELIDDGLVAALDRRELSMLNQLAPPFRRPDATTVDGSVYGVPYLWAVQALLTVRRAFPEGAPVSWRVLYTRRWVASSPFRTPPCRSQPPRATSATGSRSRSTRPSSPPSDGSCRCSGPWCGCTAACRPCSRSCAAAPSSQPPGRRASTRGAASEIEATVPQEGTIGWTQTLLLGVHAKHPRCAYRFLQFVLLPRSQARLGGGQRRGADEPARLPGRGEAGVPGRSTAARTRRSCSG